MVISYSKVWIAILIGSQDKMHAYRYAEYEDLANAKKVHRTTCLSDTIIDGAAISSITACKLIVNH